MSIAELNEDELHHMKVKHNIFGVQTGDFVTMPSVVECRCCEFEYDAESCHDEDNPPS